MTYKDLDIKKIRINLGLSQEDLAIKLGVSIRTVQNWEAGKVIPKSKHAILRELTNGNKNNEIINNQIEECNNDDVVVISREVFNQISKLTETVLSQQRTIENLSVVTKRLL